MIKTIVLLLVMLSLEISSQHIKEIKVLADNDHAKNYFPKILKSLVKLNEERVKTLQKLYVLNDHDYLKETLRNRADDYDAIIKSIKLILDELKKTNYISNGVPDFFRTQDYYYINKNILGKRLNKKPYLRDQSKDSDDDDKNSPELESLNGNSEKERGQNEDKPLRYNYYYTHSCGRPNIRCKKACNNAYKSACYYWKECSDRFRREMRKSCRSACSDRFYDGYTD